MFPLKLLPIVDTLFLYTSARRRSTNTSGSRDKSCTIEQSSTWVVVVAGVVVVLVVVSANAGSCEPSTAVSGNTALVLSAAVISVSSSVVDSSAGAWVVAWSTA
eukprot:Protomagalhaensia_wolfi_Nauph_80__1500@NODE_190_length_3241_cov_51_702686_g143_i0_p6_GENE_NODE_190_length_3241_cov_51_702686_g143_i0NODE_190_length_3241_cov_51_702686_g143_i0_p6_ORF_typecomplete_len104_score0_77Gram_pos_anchor/PF00746_21/26Gram_pos_anchor/PF00746_21/11_NODE_190_length_3241_cov_51_702686_g143_i013941705